MSRLRVATAVDILQWLEADATTPDAKRFERDRSIGREMGPSATPGRWERVSFWWETISKGLPVEQRWGQRVESFIGLTNSLLAVVGIVFGVAIAAVALAYRGDYPVNLFALLGVLVGLPLLMLLLSLTILGIGSQSFQDAMGILSPGRWAGGWLQRHVPAGFFEMASRRPLRAAFTRWQFLAFTQVFAIGYFVGVLGITAALIVFTDLAFGWSTTLDLDAHYVTGFLTALSLPWSSWMPAAVPDQVLVEASRFYRLDSGAFRAFPGIDAAYLGRWWPFVVMTVVTWGLLPRLLFALVVHLRLRWLLRQLLEEGPEITALLDRLDTPAVEFEGGISEPASAPDLAVHTVPGLVIDADSQVIVWNEALTDSRLADFLLAKGGSAAIMAAEWQSPSARREQLAPLGRHQKLIILTRGWEPPLLAFTDYLAMLRDVLGDEPVIMVVPLAVSGTGVDLDDRDVWAQALARHDDPRLYVVAAT